MKNILAQLKTVILGTFLRQVPFFIFAAMGASLLIPILADLSRVQFTEADGVRIITIFWVFTAMAYWLYARSVERLHAIDSAVIQQKIVESSAWEHSYNRLLEVLDGVDKDILHRYGLHLVLEKKKTVN